MLGESGFRADLRPDAGPLGAWGRWTPRGRLRENPAVPMRMPLPSAATKSRNAASRLRAWGVLVACASVALFLPGEPAAAAEPPAGGAPKRVLILQSFGSDFAPYNTLSSSFRSELAHALAEPVEFHEVSVQGTNSPDPAMEDALATYLVALGAGRPHDLAVAIGGQAGRFTLSHREQVFPATPVLYRRSGSTLCRS